MLGSKQWVNGQCATKSESLFAAMVGPVGVLSLEESIKGCDEFADAPFSGLEDLD